MFGRRAIIRNVSNRVTTIRKPNCSNRPLSGGSSTTKSAKTANETVAKEEAASLRAADKEKVAKTAEQTATESTEGAATAGTAEAATKKASGNDMIWYAGMGIPTVFLIWGLVDEQSPPAKLAESLGFLDMMESYAEDIVKPAHDKLLPDWSQMPNVPHDIPTPHTLVLDLENTLVSSTWDRKYGWRHAKRPGVDKFLMDMAQYYEIVLYSPSLDAVAEPVVTSLDKNHCIMHRLYRDATHYTKGVHVKDLQRLNRNINRMVVLDDDPAEVQFNPENHIRIKAYTDPSDRSDNTLERITPFLIEIAREGYSDIPALLRQYEGMDADEIADEQERRIETFQHARATRASRGLSGIAKMARRVADVTPELEPQTSSFAPAQLTAKDVVGAAPPQMETGLVGFLNRRQQEKMENDRRKYEKWQEIMAKKQQQNQGGA